MENLKDSDFTIEDLLDAYTGYQLQYIKFNYEWPDIYLAYIFYATDSYNATLNDNINRLKNEILKKYFAAPLKYEKSIQDIANIISQGVLNKFIFSQFYSYMESLCAKTKKFNFNSLCQECQNTIKICVKCKEKELFRLIVDWNSVADTIEDCLITNMSLNKNFIISKQLKHHRNDIFHYNSAADDKWDIINKDFSECLYTMLLTTMLLVEKDLPNP